MPKYKVIGERTLVEAWTYIVEAGDEFEAVEKVEECPDGGCKGVQRLDDDQCYQDDTIFSFLEEIVEKKKRASTSPGRSKGAFVKTRVKKSKK